MNNDLIRRSALKEALDTWDKFGYTAKSELVRLTPDNEKLYRPYIHYEDVINCIDNATTVELPDFKAGYKQAILDGKTQYQRPQGEWITDSAGNITCSNCRFSLGSKVVKLLYPFDFSFCPDCGTRMQKGGAE